MFIFRNAEGVAYMFRESLGNPVIFHLEKGKHKLSLWIHVGYGPYLQNQIYRKVDDFLFFSFVQ